MPNVKQIYDAEHFKEAQVIKGTDTSTKTFNLLKEIVEQLKVMNNTLEEIHDELHEFTNRGSY